MDIKPPPAGGIVVGLDGSPSSHEALGWAAEQAALERRPLVLAHAVPALRLPDSSLRGFAGVDLAAMARQLREVATTLLEDACVLARDRHPGLDVHQVLSSDDARRLLLDLGERAAVLVLGSRGHGPVASLLLGSVSAAVSVQASCPVVVRRPAEPVTPRYGVLVGVGPDDAQPALEFAYRMASARTLPLTVLHLWGDDRSREETGVAHLVSAMAEKFPEVHVASREARGSPERHLVAATHNYDLVVVGHRAGTRFGDLAHRSVAAAVVEHAHGPVAVVSSPPYHGASDVRR